MNVCVCMSVCMWCGGGCCGGGGGRKFSQCLEHKFMIAISLPAYFLGLQPRIKKSTFLPPIIRSATSESQFSIIYFDMFSQTWRNTCDISGRQNHAISVEDSLSPIFEDLLSVIVEDS